MHTHTKAPLLSVKDLTVSFDGHKALDNVSFELFPEEVLAVIGPNGAGKSVLLKSLVGIVKPTSGTINWAEGTKIGYLPQRFHVDHYLPMTVEEFLSLKPHGKKKMDKPLLMAKVDASLMKKSLAHISSGQLQKVLLAWTLIDEPNVLLFDEPTENVDVVSQETIYSLLHNIQDHLGLSILIVSHDLHVVFRYANHVLGLNRSVVSYGEPRKEMTNGALGELYGDHAYFHHHLHDEGHHHETGL